jgi:signal transduction histidine kinase
MSRSSIVGPALLVLAVALIVGVPTLVLGELAANDTRTRVRDAQLEAQRSATGRVAGAIATYFESLRYYLRYAARPNLGRITPLATALESRDQAAIERELSALYRVFPSAEGLHVYGPGGEWVAAVGAPSQGRRGIAGLGGGRPDPLPIPRTAFPQLQLPQDLLRALEQGGPVAVDPWDDAAGIRDRMTIGMAVVGADPRKPAGHVFSGFDLLFVGEALLLAADTVSEAYVVDRNGRVLRRLSRALANDPEAGRDLSASDVIADVIAGRRVEGERVAPWGGGSQLITTRTLEPLIGIGGAPDLDLGWHVVAAQPIALVYADVEAALTQFRYVRVGLLALLLTGALALGVSLQQIRTQRRLLQIASRHKSEFLANMSHELRTPLNAVIGFSEVLLQQIAGTVNAKQAEYLQDIRASGRHLLALINDILDLSKVEAGRMELQLGELSLPTVLGDGVTMVRERANEHHITISLDVDPSLGSVVADERKLKQVVANLLSNAVKFTPDGGRIAVHAARADGEVKVAVEDSGVGIAPNDQARIFEEFEQTEHGREAAEGTGLGLTLSKKIIELHGGRIWVDSEVGHGSTFTFALPLVPAGKEA